MAKHAISPQLYEDLTEKLDTAMDERDDVAEKKARVTRALGGELRVLDNQIKRLRRQRKGIESLQEEIPGTEAGERKRDPTVETLLRAADGLPARAKAEKQEVGGITTITLRTAGGKSVTATQEQMRAALGELDRRKKAKGSKKFSLGTGLEEPCTACSRPFGEHAGQSCPKPASGQLAWRTARPGVDIARVEGGVYQVSVLGTGKWIAEWRAAHKPGTLVGAYAGSTQDEAHVSCERHHLERLADEKLRHAGAGELTRADTKGDAVARKKGGRRG